MVKPKRTQDIYFPVWSRFFEAIARGQTVDHAAVTAGVARSAARKRVSKNLGMNFKAGRKGTAPGAHVREGVSGSGRITHDERVQIALRVRDGYSSSQIARELGRDRSVIWREIRRNSSSGEYIAGVADVFTFMRSRRPKKRRLDNPALVRFVEDAMDQGWSPKLISLVLARDFAHDKTMQISHETIYQAIYVQGRGQLRKDLYRCLSTGRAKRIVDGRGLGRNQSPYKDALKISQRPPSVEDRAVPGHWEADLIMSGATSNAAIGTLVERTTRYTILLHLPDGHDAVQVSEAIKTAMKKLPADLRRTLTYDRGTEMARYREIQTALDLEVYFCDPHSPWQRGTNENTNRLLRHWFAKSSDLSIHTAADLKRVQDSLNNRPRPTLGLETPNKRFKELLNHAT